MIPSVSLGTDAVADRSGRRDACGPHPAAAAARRFRFELPAHPVSVARARQLTRARLIGWAMCEDTCDTAALVISELVTNAIVHTAGEHVVCELHDQDEVVRIAVRDGGCTPGEPRPAQQRPDEEYGRGLLLVAALCRAWGAQEAGPGLLVWADLPSQAGRSAPGGATPCPGPAGEALGALSDPGWSAKKPPTDGGARSDLGWSAKRPPADGRGSGPESSRETGPAGV